MQPDSLSKKCLSDTGLSYEQNGPAFVQPLQAIEILDLCLSDGAAGRKVDILERCSHGKLGALDPMAGLLLLPIVDLRLQQCIDELRASGLIPGCIRERLIEAGQHAE